MEDDVGKREVVWYVILFLCIFVISVSIWFDFSLLWLSASWFLYGWSFIKIREYLIARAQLFFAGAYLISAFVSFFISAVLMIDYVNH